MRYDPVKLVDTQTLVVTATAATMTRNLTACFMAHSKSADVLDYSRWRIVQVSDGHEDGIQESEFRRQEESGEPQIHTDGRPPTQCCGGPSFGIARSSEEAAMEASEGASEQDGHDERAEAEGDHVPGLPQLEFPRAHH